MRILHVIPTYYPAIRFGGPIISVHELNKALVRKGIKVTVCTSNYGLENKSKGKSFSETVDGVTVWYFSCLTFFDFLSPTGYQFSPTLRKWLEEHVKKYDLVHISAVWNYPVLAGARGAYEAGKPYILSPRGALYPYTFKKKFWKKRIYFQLVVKKILERTSAIHYTTEDEKEQCHEFLGLKNRAVVVPNGLDLSEFSNSPSKKEFFNKFPHLAGKKLILYLGRINWKKGVDILIEAFSVIARERKDVYLVLVGEDDGDGYKARMQSLAKKLGIAERVTFTGILTGREKLAAYRAAEIFILPSYSENFGMVVIEAMACKCPVIISNRVGIYREVQQAEAGIIIEPAVSDIVKAIKLLIDNKELRKRISEDGYKLVKNQYDIDKVAENMIEVYENIVRGI